MESDPLTSSESAIVRLVAQGLTNSLIAYRLDLALPTLENQLAAIYKKLGVLSRLELLFSICSGELEVVGDAGKDEIRKAPRERYTPAA